MESVEHSGGGGKKDIVFAAFLSLLMHGALLAILFYPIGQSRGTMGPITAAERLSHAEEYIFKDLQGLVSTYRSQAEKLAPHLESETKEAWALQNMPASLTKVLKAAGVEVTEVKSWPSSNNKAQKEPAAEKGPATEKDSAAEKPEEIRYTIGVKLDSQGWRVFNDVLAVAHALGHATLYSDFWSDNVEIRVTEKAAVEIVQIIMPTMDCRLLYRNKLSPQEFLMGASVRRGVSS